ncbi:dihydrodipicolinate synthase family protein [Mycolicibacterium agri]|uniref:Dihydrodipicolinate synthase family protein n=1 Tax=Mycolicibacterium agri TaxID=36811 RepID=A0A2A7MW12_MYCAG|nr:dihydrodipicolinate synthase family protein [Mycolicibacterium agri]PEG35521.1 dihydrodipicolinate synthase family protein [Mycolicibacterium agri]GFG48969.1 dihydrodipicolinate synthase family protein [Mycolicibacterium agri]
MTQPLSQGLWGVLATPFDERLDVDLDSLRNEVNSFVADGCGGLVALGVFGEAASLNPDEADSVARTVASSTDLPYVLGLSEREPDAVIAQAGRLLEAVPRPPVALMAQIADTDPAVAAASLKRLHDATGIGILIQDYPVISGVHVTDEQVVEIVSGCPFAVGVKSETPPTSVAVAHLVPRVDVPVFGGLGGVGLLDELAAGSAGAMTGFSHPAALAAVLRAHSDGGFEAARAAWAPWLPLANFEGQLRVGLSIRKELLRRRGVISTGRVRPPAMPLPDSLVPLLEQHLATLPATATR